MLYLQTTLYIRVRARREYMYHNRIHSEYNSTNNLLNITLKVSRPYFYPGHVNFFFIFKTYNLTTN